MDLSKFRNIGISAHIDSGKNHPERAAFCFMRVIHRINEVKGGGDVSATMDYMDPEPRAGDHDHQPPRRSSGKNTRST